MNNVEVISFQAAMKSIENLKYHRLLLGNGFSIALRPDIFTYGSLYDNADFSAAPLAPSLFAALKTKDFEIVIRHLQDAANVIEVYQPSLIKLANALRKDASAIKDALVSAVANRHPDKPYDIDESQYIACRVFLSHFNHIYTMNYDVLLYWTLMHDDIDDLAIPIDDGFRHPEDDPESPYVSWQAANTPTIHYLHGALHLFDTESDIVKYTWSKTDVPIVDQIRKALYADKYPLFVAEGTSVSKHSRILHNAYLHKALRSFEQICKTKDTAIVIFGHSLAQNDDHILRHIVKGNVKKILVSLFGSIDSPANQEIIANALNLVYERSQKKPNLPLDVAFFDAESAHVWG